MQASQQEHRDKYQYRGRHAEIHRFRHDISENKVFGHDRLL
jgi:hypothetical protein